MRILILGASGLIGGNLMRYTRDELNWNVLGTYFSYAAKDCLYFNTLDISDPKNVDFKKLNPEVVVHCGALTWVDYCEENIDESFEKTVQSTINALAIAKECNAKFVYLSTDYVFDGLNGPYREDDKVNALSVYGKHKLEAEELVKASGLDHIIGRVTNVYGDEERGKNFIARLVKTAESGEKAEMHFPSDQYATPVNAYDVARALTALIKADKTGIYNLASTDYLNRYQLAQMVLKHFPENNIDIRPVLTSELGQKAPRPLNGGLITAKFLAEFPTFEFGNVSDYITNYKNKD